MILYPKQPGGRTWAISLPFDTAGRLAQQIRASSDHPRLLPTVREIHGLVQAEQRASHGATPACPPRPLFGDRVALCSLSYPASTSHPTGDCVWGYTH